MDTKYDVCKGCGALSYGPLCQFCLKVEDKLQAVAELAQPKIQEPSWYAYWQSGGK